jgi:eukaryotic-like serine/threonine-protein kinase
MASLLEPMTTTQDDPNLGRLLSNRYRLVELVGRGAMGRVYKAEDILLGGVLAVKILAQTLMNSKMRDRFKIEASTCAQLGQKSIHIVRVTDYGLNEEDVPFYVMEYLQGESLSDLIKGRTITLPKFLSLGRQICLGLQCAHEGLMLDGKNYAIIHRDIKPSNILVNQDASLGELVKILDFGISKIQAETGQTSSYMGTLAYSSPEQMEGRVLDHRSDIYSLGVMLFEMLTGKMPLMAETHTFGAWYKVHHSAKPRTFAQAAPNLKVPKALETLIMSCLSKQPAQRPQTVADMLRALEPLEQRYRATRQAMDRIGETLESKQPQSLAVVQPSVSLRDELIQRSQWPKNKPVAKIVFPQIVNTREGLLPTIWVMLPDSDIQNFQMRRLYNKIYKNFLCTMSPHPMLLWATAIQNSLDDPPSDPRWMPCFLDLKGPQGQELTRLLSEKGQYHILLFALERPTQCIHTIDVEINPAQRSQLQNWAITSQAWTSVGQPGLSKDLLKQELEKMKIKAAEWFQISDGLN